MRARKVTTSHWVPDDSGPPLLTHAVINGRLREVAAQVPDRVALAEGLPTPEGRRWTYGELLASIDRCIQKFAVREAWERGEQAGHESRVSNHRRTAPKGAVRE